MTFKALRAMDAGRVTVHAALALVGLALGAAPALAEENQGITKDEILIGSVLDLSGPVAAIGVPVREGQDMAIQAANDAGGVNGRKIRIIYGDSAYDPKKAIIATQKI